MAAQPLIGWDIFDYSSETTEQNLTKLDIKQDINVLYKVCVFRADWKNTMTENASGWGIFDFSSETTKRNSTKHDRKQDLNVCRGHKYQMAITHKIYSLRGSFPKLTNSLSPKMYSCLIKNEKIILGRLHKVYLFIGGSIGLRASSSTSSSSM